MYFNGEVLTSVTCTKYLGVVIDSSAQDNVDILRHVRAIYTRGNMLISRFNICTDEVKLCLFRSYLSSIYGGQLWTNFKSNVFKKAVVAYNNVYRKFFNIRRGPSMSAIYVNSGIDHFNVLVRKNLGSFRRRLLNCNNALVSCIVKSVFICSILVCLLECRMSYLLELFLSLMYYSHIYGFL